jgi:hypothetical protein
MSGRAIPGWTEQPESVAINDVAPCSWHVRLAPKTRRTSHCKLTDAMCQLPTSWGRLQGEKQTALPPSGMWNCNALRRRRRDGRGSRCARWCARRYTLTRHRSRLLTSLPISNLQRCLRHGSPKIGFAGLFQRLGQHPLSIIGPLRLSSKSL